MFPQSLPASNADYDSIDAFVSDFTDANPYSGMPSSTLSGDNRSLGLRTSLRAPRFALRTQRSELDDEPVVLAELQLGGDALLQREQPQLVEVRADQLRQPLGGDAGEHRAAPQLQRLAQQRRAGRRVRVPGRGCGAGT